MSASTTAVGRSLWRPAETRLCFVVGALGGGLCLAAWTVAAGRAHFDEQTPLTGLSMLGLGVMLMACTTFVLRGRRAIGTRAEYLLGLRHQATASLTDPVAASAPAPAAEAVGGEGLLWYHRTDCALAVVRDGWTTASPAEHQRAGRKPCDACRP